MNSQSQKGFTLVELLLSIAVSAVILLVTTMLLSTLLQTRIKNQVIMEVEQNGSSIMRVIERYIRNSDGVTFPSAGASANSLTLVMPQSGINPTIFDLASGSLRIKEGAATPINLSSSRVVISDFTVDNVSRNDTPGAVRIQFTVTTQSLGNRNEYNYTKTFYGTANVR